MISRRLLLGGAASVVLATPGILRAHTEQPFVLDEKFQPREVRVRDQYEPGQILVFPRNYFLYHVFAPERAIRYGVGVGKAGLEFRGSATIERKAEWPSWRPTNEMIRRNPKRYAQIRWGPGRCISIATGATPTTASMARPSRGRSDSPCRTAASGC